MAYGIRKDDGNMGADIDERLSVRLLQFRSVDGRASAGAAPTTV
jgi:hypothetical protein